MMGGIVSLKLHRKRKERAERDGHAAANRAKFGRGKEEKSMHEACAKMEEKHLDAHKREE